MAPSEGPPAGLDLVAGNIALDFANSVYFRTATTPDYLGTYDGLVAWAEWADLLAPETGQELRRLAAGDSPAAHQALQRAHRLRTAIYRAFSAIAAGESPPPTESRRILQAYGAAVARGTLEQAPGEPALAWPLDSTMSAFLDPIAFAAGELLLAPDRPPIKECDGCPWLFVDRSRNGRRRWCDMRTCGTRDKMRRYYRSRRTAPA